MKKSFKNIFLLAVLSIAILPIGCKKGWLDVNYNPRELTDNSATPDLLLAPLLEDLASYPEDFEIVNMWMGYWASPSLPPTINFTRYDNVPSVDIPSSTLPFLEQKSATLGMDFYLGIAKVMRAIKWGSSVDRLNDVPYTEAFQASILQPKYDDGQLIYEDLMKQLTMASTLIKNADVAKNEKIGLTDIMFHGDKTKWRQLINTLKLRLLIHQANRPDRADYIAAEIVTIKNEGAGFLPTGVSASVNPGYALTNKISPFYRFYSSHNTRGGGRGDLFSGINSVDFAHANEYALNLLKADSDPRIGYIYSTIDVPFPAGGNEPFPQPAPNTFRGSRFGLPINSFTFPYQNKRYLSAVGGSRNTDVVTPASSGIIKGNNMDGFVLTSVESAFLQAEAVLRGWIPGNAEQVYKDAVAESFKWLNVGGNSANPSLSQNQFDQWYNAQTGLGNPKVSWAAAPDKYKLLMYQKYMSLNGIAPLESWTDYRRNGRFPDVPVSADPTRVGNTVPYRFVYTRSEVIANAENIKALGEINMFTGKIWWMP